MGVEGRSPATEAKQRLARLLRSWWEEDPGKVTQEALVRRITERGVRTSQEMLSRYLHRTRPTLARPDVIRAMHQVLGRAPDELTTALALHGEASSVSGSAPVAAPEPAVVPEVLSSAEEEVASTVAEARGPVADPADAASGTDPAPDPAPGPADGAASVADPAPAPAVFAGTATEPAPAAPPVSGSRGARRLWIALAASVVVGVSVLTAVVTHDRDGDDRERAQSPAGPPAASFPVSAAPTVTAECRGASCFGIDPKYAVCREDAVTYYTGSGHGIRVELRFSPTCQAAWAKMSGTSQGDVVRITNNAGRSRHYTQQWGHDAHSTMVEALNPDDAKACARIPRGEVCATVPVSR